MTGPVRLKHQRITVALEREIRSGQVPRGARLPGELALARRFGVSRTTVRTALAELNEAGLITTRTGKGSFVLFDGRPLDDRLGWAHALAAQGVETRTRVLRIALCHREELCGRGDLCGREELCRRDGLAGVPGLDSPEVVVIERVREVAPQTVVSYERSCVPAVGELRDLPARGLAGSLTEALNRAGLHPDHGEQRLSGRMIDDREAELLRREPGAWFLSARRTSWAGDGTFIERVDSLLDPAHFELSLTFGEKTS
ncbi:GntR family transcriptional regulator [Planotetraspora thailandica]|uniref:GntR family transcriptional regulator n=1 Tax=Planotetraspora thailandica TaxID=487172 RepID=A0A8J4DDS4_9ACTN|nr:GntR family transcriptional regulator [Planotetraspora thailandica]GII58350.1 GntR family transcriptional regulator [Planotetraspora thailandica]